MFFVCKALGCMKLVPREDYVLIQRRCWRVSTSIGRVHCGVAVLVVAVHVHPVVGVPLVATDGVPVLGSLLRIVLFFVCY